MDAIHSHLYKQLMPSCLGKPTEGKARLIYEIPDSESPEHPWGLLLFVAKDDVSTHNIVHNTPLPWKGYTLTAFSVLGFSLFDTAKPIALPHHLVAYGKDIYHYLPKDKDWYPDDLHLRALVVEKLIMLPVEFVFREYLCGSLFKGPYQRGEDPYGISLPEGLPVMSKLSTTQKFTPTAKSKNDEPLGAIHTRNQFRQEFSQALDAWERCREFVGTRDLELVDGKLELGWRLEHYGDTSILTPVIADEPPLTPDNVRMARREDIEVGAEPPWFGKENVRRWVEEEWKRMGITEENRRPLEIPKEVAKERGREDYYNTFHTLSGQTLEEFWAEKGF